MNELKCKNCKHMESFYEAGNRQVLNYVCTLKMYIIKGIDERTCDLSNEEFNQLLSAKITRKS